MSGYSYVAVDPHGLETRGIIDVADQAEALRRIKEMGLFPTKVLGADDRRSGLAQFRRKTALPRKRVGLSSLFFRFGRRVPFNTLTAFTRQLATLIEAGMPLLRSLRILEEQEENRRLT